jgi:hypothetical protein
VAVVTPVGCEETQVRGETCGAAREGRCEVEAATAGEDEGAVGRREERGEQRTQRTAQTE